MKRLLTTLIVALAATTAAYSQKGLHIASIFDGEYRKKTNVTEVEIKGMRLIKYDLTLFRSITVANDPAIAAKIESLVKADGKSATDRETGIKGGRLYYAIYSFRKSDGSYRYILFRNNLLIKGKETTIVYMEGDATLPELKKMFK